jgi:TolB-like protein
MKKIIVCFILFFSVSIIFGQTNVPAVVVSTFSTRGQSVTADDAESITELFIAELAKQSGVRVVDRTSIARVIAEMKFQTGDWSDPQKTARLGAALNAEFLVRGQINQLGQQISVAITALDIKTLEVISSSTETFAKDYIFAGWGNVGGDSSIFRKMPSMASNIASPIKTKMAEQEQRRQFAGITGTWRATGNNYTHTETNTSGPNQLLITFGNDGSFTYTMNECYYATRFNSPTGGSFYGTTTGFVLKLQTEGNGSFEFDGSNRIKFKGNYRTNGIIFNTGRSDGIWSSSSPYNKNDVINFNVTFELTSNGQIMQWKERPIMSGSFDDNNQFPTMFQKVSSR